MANNVEVFRGFIAVEIPVIDPIQQIQNEIRKTSANIKFVEAENIHITLKFLGDTQINQIKEIESIMIDAVQTIKKHTILLKGTGVFPNEKYVKVLWIGIKQSDQLTRIAESINQSCTRMGIKKDKRGFSAHLTIGRMRNAQAKEEILTIIEKYKEMTFAEIPVNEIHLKKSTLTPKGPIYQTLKTIPLIE